MPLIPELLGPKAQGHTQMETQSPLLPPWFRKPGLFLEVSSPSPSPHQVLHLTKFLPSCLQGIANHRPVGLKDTSF